MTRKGREGLDSTRPCLETNNWKQLVRGLHQLHRRKAHGRALLRVNDSQTLVSDLAASHGEQLWRFLAARVRVVDVPDIVQEVYLRMLRIHNIESIRSPEAYLFTVAQHVVQQHTLRQTRMPRSVGLAQMLDDLPSATPDIDPVLATDAAQCIEQLQRAMEELSPKVRATFLLHRRDGLSFDDIGARLGLSRPMVKKNLMKALMHFRLRLDQVR